MQTPSSASPERSSILQSPWYWLYVFCTAAIIGLMLFGGKLAQRQLQVERNFQGRQRAIEQRAGETPSTGLSSEGDTALSLRPLYLLLGGGLIVSWIPIWWHHFRYRRAAGAGTQAGNQPDASPGSAPGERASRGSPEPDAAASSGTTRR